MLESPVYREILEEGRQEGEREREQKGRRERLHEYVLEVLKVRFGQVPAELEAQVRQLRDEQILKGLHRRAILVESLEVFAQELSQTS